MTENENSPENLRKFLESDDPALVRMGISMAKNIQIPKEIHAEIVKLIWNKHETIRTAAVIYVAKEVDNTEDNKLVTWLLSYFYGNSEAKEIVKNDPAYLGGIKAEPDDTNKNWLSTKNTIESIIYDNVSEEVRNLIFARMSKDLRASPFYGTDFIDILRILADAADIELNAHIEELFGPPECRECGSNGYEEDEDYCSDPDCENNGGMLEVVLPRWLENYLY